MQGGVKFNKRGKLYKMGSVYGRYCPKGSGGSLEKGEGQDFKGGFAVLADIFFPAARYVGIHWFLSVDADDIDALTKLAIGLVDVLFQYRFSENYIN